MTRWLVALTLVAGCSGGSQKPAPAPAPLENTSGPDTPAQVPINKKTDEPEPPDEPSDQATSVRPGDSQVIIEFAAITDNMCGCREKSCAEAVNAQFEAWMKRYQNATGSRGEQERAKKLAESYTKCMMNAMTGGQP